MRRIHRFFLFVLLSQVLNIAFAADQTIAPYAARFGRARPVIAVVGENARTVLSDYAIPYGLLVRSGLADVISVATGPGLLKLAPLHIEAEATMASFDARYPDGADYVVVPAVSAPDDAALSAWVSAQAARGATMISICNGALVLAHAGLTRGRRATAHWSTYRSRIERYPDTQWVKNTRYVVDGKIISSAGITAAIPVSLALVEAIGGTARATELAAAIGADGWSAQHDSDAFCLTVGDYFHGAVNTVFHATEEIGLPVAPGVDEIALALTAEAYSDTLRSRVVTIATSTSNPANPASVKTRGGLMLVADRVAGQGAPPESLLPALASDGDGDGTPDALLPDKLLTTIAARYGAASARLIVLDWEYPATRFLGL